MPQRWISGCLFALILLNSQFRCGLAGEETVNGISGQIDVTQANGNQTASDSQQRFETTVRPILTAKCISCHGAKTQKSELDLSTPIGILKGGESGPSLDREHPEEGILFEYISDELMPPEGETPLTNEERQTLLDWAKDRILFPSSSEQKQNRLTQHDALPILLLRCAACHGAQRQRGGLDVRTKASLLKGGKSGPAIVVGDPETSLLLKKIHSGAMPPKEKLASFSVKPVSQNELETLTQWIKEGADEIHIEPDVATRQPDPLVSEQDRQFWAFQKPFASQLPVVKNSDRIQNPVDTYILAQLEKRGLTLSEAASRQTLVRRVYFDLIGLPPTPKEVDGFLHDGRPDAYEQLLDRLLASPRYGERWGQYWLDLSGYSDSEGVQHADPIRPHAWRYRDYVIRAFNSDKPYSRFLQEQIAGDELADYEKGETVAPEVFDNLVATGFLRMAPDGTNASITAFVPDRLEIIDDEIEIFSSAILGLTIRCARCHTHKFDPIPQRDYYRLAAIFKGAFDENDWMTPTGTGPAQPKDSLVRLLPQVTKEEIANWKASGSDKKNKPSIRALWDRGRPSDTYILKRGSYLTRGRLVGPGVPSVLTNGRTELEVKPPWPGAKSTGRRLALANWLVSPENPLTARVMVNRLWKHHFGVGLVSTLDNFGTTGAPPSHPKLLDWLAIQFVESGWSLKSMHRLLMTSATYRQSSQVSQIAQQKDPTNRLLSRMLLRRMEGEVLRDTLLSVSGTLDTTPFGPPDPVDARADGLITAAKRPGAEDRRRRSIYLLKRRTQPVSILQSFDIPTMNPNCVKRSESIVAPQALHLNNDQLVRRLATAFAERVMAESGGRPEDQIECLFQLAVSRAPTRAERDVALAIYQATVTAWSQSEDAVKQDANWPKQKAVENLCHTVMNSASFLYID